MSKANCDGEAKIEAYITSLGLRVERFSKAELGEGRTPDFRVFVDDELAFYCEVKTAQHDDLLDTQFAPELPLTLVGGLRPDPIYNRIDKYIYSSVKQFDAVNRLMDFPNVLAIVNHDEKAGITDLISVVTGKAYCQGGEVVSMFREHSDDRIREAKLRVHLYLWTNECTSGPPQMIFQKVNPKHHAVLRRYFRPLH